MKVQELINLMLKERTDIRETTRAAYQVETRRMKPFLGRKLEDITAFEVERWAGSDQKLRRSVRSLKSVINWCIRHGYASSNPIASCRGPKIITRTHQPGIHRSLELVDKFAKPRDRAMVLLLLDTGIRVREAIALTWDRVLLEERMIVVDRSLSPSGEYQGMKTAGSEREITISEATAEALAAIRPKVEYDVPVFRNRWGTRLNLNNWYHRVWQPTLQDAGISLRIHDLRHACATLLLESGVPISAVQQRLGHSEIHTTAKFYTRRSRALSKQAASAMDGILRRPK